MRILALLLLLCVLAGCSGAPDSYLSVTPHAASSDRVAELDAVTVTDYAQLKGAILDLVRAGQAEGSIRAANYNGDLESDLAEAAYEVSKVEPLGAYAVDYMTHDCTLIVNYYKIDIRITFRRTAQEIASIETLLSQTLLRTRLEQAVDRLEERVTLEIRNYRETDIPALVQSYCEAHPDTVMEIPSVSVAIYPEGGTTRILEIDLHCTESPAALKEKARAVRENVDAAAEYIRYRQTDREKIELLFTYLTERFTYEKRDTATPVHDALCAGVVDAAGLAHAFRMICDRAGLDCHTVSGLRDGEPHIWNIVSFDGEHRHVDLFADIPDGVLRFRTDDEMTEYYWNQAAYPACFAVPEPTPEEQPPTEEVPPEEMPEEPAPEEAPEAPAPEEIPEERPEEAPEALPEQTPDAPEEPAAP